MANNTSILSKWSWIAVIFYLFLGIFTFFSILYSDLARQIFSSTEFFMQFNFLWFGSLIVLYGFYALIRNYQRISRLGINSSLDTQFLIVMMFLFLTGSLLFNFILYFDTSLTSSESLAISSLSSVIMYGALVFGLLSIIIPKLQARNKKVKKK